MDKVRAIIQRKPTIFLIISLVYFLIVGFLKWHVRPPIEAIWFLVGGAMGIYFLDAAEEFFNLNPSPFRSIVFQILFMIVSAFVVTSSGSLLASGLVLSLYLSLILWQIGEWQVVGNLSSWYRLVAGVVSTRTQLLLTLSLVVLFIFETLVFIR